MVEEPAFFAPTWGLQVEPEGQGLLGGREGKGGGRGEGEEKWDKEGWRQTESHGLLCYQVVVLEGVEVRVWGG